MPNACENSDQLRSGEVTTSEVAACSFFNGSHGALYRASGFLTEKAPAQEAGVQAKRTAFVQRWAEPHAALVYARQSEGHDFVVGRVQGVVKAHGGAWMLNVKPAGSAGVFRVPLEEAEERTGCEVHSAVLGFFGARLRGAGVSHVVERALASLRDRRSRR